MRSRSRQHAEKDQVSGHDPGLAGLSHDKSSLKRADRIPINWLTQFGHESDLGKFLHQHK